MERYHSTSHEQSFISWTDLAAKMREQGVDDGAIRALVERGVKEGHSAPNADIAAAADLLIETQARRATLKGERVPSALEADAPTRVLHTMGEKAVRAGASGRISGTLEPEPKTTTPVYSTPPPELRKNAGVEDLSTANVREYVKNLYKKSE